MLAIVLASYLMIVLDISIVICAVPEIGESLVFSPIGFLAHRMSAALTAGAAMLALALAVVAALIVRPRPVTSASSPGDPDAGSPRAAARQAPKDHRHASWNTSN